MSDSWLHYRKVLREGGESYEREGEGGVEDCGRKCKGERKRGRGERS